MQCYVIGSQKSAPKIYGLCLLLKKYTKTVYHLVYVEKLGSLNGT